MTSRPRWRAALLSRGGRGRGVRPERARPTPCAADSPARPGRHRPGSGRCSLNGFPRPATPTTPTARRRAPTSSACSTSTTTPSSSTCSSWSRRSRSPSRAMPAFRVDLTVGSSIPHVDRRRRACSATPSGQARRTSTCNRRSRAGSRRRVRACGSMSASSSPIVGYEVIQGYDGWNDHATRSQLFGYAIPFTHVGVRATYAASPHVSLDGDGASTAGTWPATTTARNRLGAQIALTPTAAGLGLPRTGMWGPERSGNDGDSRSLLDVEATLRSWSAG